MGLLYNKYYLNSNDLGVIIFQNLLVSLLPGILFVAFINFRGPGTLLIGGVY